MPPADRARTSSNHSRKRNGSRASTGAVEPWGLTHGGVCIYVTALEAGVGSPGSDYDDDSDYDLGDLEILLLIAEVAFGLSLDEADLDSPLLKVPDEPADPARRTRAPAPSAVDTELVRAHVRHLIDRGVSADTIAAQARMNTSFVDFLLSGRMKLIPALKAQQILAIEAPPQSAP